MDVSIIIPIYDVEPYICACLQSVMKQTKSENVECILVDDCGHDNSLAIAEQLVCAYEGLIHFVIIHHDYNKGLSAARNTGINAANGKYLYFLDSDDTITADCLSSLWAMVEKYPKVECVFAGAKASEGYEFMDYSKKCFPEYSDDRDWIQDGMLKRFLFSMTAWNRLISANFVRNNKLFFEEGFFHEDEIWNLAISMVICRASFVNQNTYNYNVREESIMCDEKSDYNSFFIRRMRVWRKMLSMAKGCRVNEQIAMIFNYVDSGVDRINSIKQYLVWHELAFRTLLMIPFNHSSDVITKIYFKSIYFTKSGVYKCLHR